MDVHFHKAYYYLKTSNKYNMEIRIQQSLNKNELTSYLYRNMEIKYIQSSRNHELVIS